MLDIDRLQEQFDGFNAYQSQEQAQQARRLVRALEALRACDPDWQTLREKAATANVAWLRAGLRGRPLATAEAPERPTPVTVVASDGSQIYPDRHVEPTCYLLNVSRIAFQYGTLERPLMEAVPDFRYRRHDQDGFDDLLESATADVVSAVRDGLELEALYATALECRVEGRPLVAMADGTLIRWMIRNLQNRKLEDRLIASYAKTLQAFREDRIPLCSYVSMPGNTEVVNLLRIHLDERDGDAETLAGLVDRKLFERTLRPGERSATFESTSHVLQEYGQGDRICYFYLRVPVGAATEIARVEVPAWVADAPELLGLVHAVVLSECQKGDGYPMILAEAHERAVIRARERDLFYRLIERQMTAAGLPLMGSQKAASKRRPTV